MSKPTSCLFVMMAYSYSSNLAQMLNTFWIYFYFESQYLKLDNSLMQHSKWAIAMTITFHLICLTTRQIHPLVCYPLTPHESAQSIRCMEIQYQPKLLWSWQSLKVCGPWLNINLMYAPIFWDVSDKTHVVKNGQQKVMRYDEISQCVPPYEDTILCSIPTTIKRTQILAHSFTYI